MSKRFTATTKWTDPWFCSLSERNRLFWVFLLDNCDHAGIWRANWMLVEVYFPGFGQDLSVFSERMIRIDGEKWFIPKFVDFQYGELNSENRAHHSVMCTLRKEGAYKLLTSSIQGAKDKDKDKEEEKEKEKGKSLATELPKSQEPEKPRPETDIQKIMKGWKILNEIPTEGQESKDWDKVHFPKNVRYAQSLLTLFGDWEKATDAMEYVYMHLKSKKLDCTLNTIVNRSDLYREYQAGRKF